MSSGPAETPARPRSDPERLGALDGIRGCALLAVVSFHLDIAYGDYRPRMDPLRLAGGFIGVDVFFVLSGYLITTLLIREHEEHGDISLKAFYARRALRIFPALGAAIVLSLVVLGVLNLIHRGAVITSATLTGLPFVVLYVGNWYAAFHSGFDLGLLLQTWSLAIEEQFYLLAPILLVIAMRFRIRRSRLAAGLILLAAVEMVVRAALAYGHHDVFTLYYGTDTHSDGLMVGCALAFLLATPRVATLLAARRARWTIDAVAVLAGLAIAALALRSDQDLPSGVGLAIPCTVVLTALILTSVVNEPASPMRRLLELRPLVWLGRRSYGLYLYSFIIGGLVFFGFPGLGRHQKEAIIIVATGLAAAISFRYLEVPFLRKRRRYSRARPAALGSSPPRGPGRPGGA